MPPRRKKKIAIKGKYKVYKGNKGVLETHDIYSSYSDTGAPELRRFVEKGGQKCLDLFQYLSSSSEWRNHGTIPPLNDEDAALLNHMYRLWQQHQNEREDYFETSPNSPSLTADSIAPSSHTVSVATCLITIKDSISEHHQYVESLSTMLSQMDILTKAPEPTRSHATDLLELLISPDFINRDVNALERLASNRNNHKNSAAGCVALALLAESEHLLSSTTADLLGRTTHVDNSVYDKAAVLFYTRAAHCDAPSPIAAMQLGARFLRGGLRVSSSGHISTGDMGPDYKAAFEWFKRAAHLQNPIAQHKVGYFYDEGLPDGVCEVNIMEAVRWYSQAAELMPDSMHNLAKIYEDGRGGFEPDMKQAVTLYSVAAARGFPLSQVNLGRLFLLGEDGVTRDRDAGKRLLTLAAESGDADAQMVVGMIHATPAFECYDLRLSEHWLRQSLAGGKQDAERLLVRVSQQIAQQRGTGDIQESNMSASSGSVTGTPVSLDAAAAKQRGDDFVSHGLLHAAVLEFSRAFELDRSKLSYFVDRLEALCSLGHYEECLADSSLLLLSENGKGELNIVNNRLVSKGEPVPVDFLRMSTSQEQRSDDTPERVSDLAMFRMYNILVESLGYLFSSACHVQSFDERLSVDQSNRFEQSMVSNFDVGEQGYSGLVELSKAPHAQNQQQIAEDYMCSMHYHHREAIVQRLLLRCMGWQTQSLRSAAFLARLTSCEKYYSGAVIRSGGVPILLSLLSSSPPRTDDSAVGQRKAELYEQLWLNCATILHNISFSHAAKTVLILLSAADGYEALRDCVQICKNGVQSNAGVNFRNVVLVRTVVTVMQIILSCAYMATEDTWQEMVDSGLVAMLVSALECGMSATQIENSANRCSLCSGPTDAFESESRDIGDACLENIDKLHMDIMHCIARLFKIAPVHILVQASADTMALFQRILIAVIGLNGISDSLRDGIKSSAIFCLCRLLCAQDPSNAELIQKSLSADDLRELLTAHGSNSTNSEEQSCSHVQGYTAVRK